jgi:hypothetical protein
MMRIMAGNGRFYPRWISKGKRRHEELCSEEEDRLSLARGFQKER